MVVRLITLRNSPSLPTFTHTDQDAYPGKRLIFLDSAASSQKPQQVIDAMSKYYTHDHANVHRGAYSLANRATGNNYYTTTSFQLHATAIATCYMLHATDTRYMLHATCYSYMLHASCFMLHATCYMQRATRVPSFLPDIHPSNTPLPQTSTRMLATRSQVF